MDEIAVFEDYEIEGLPRTEANLKWLWEHFQCTDCGQCCEIHKTGARISRAEAKELATRSAQSLDVFLQTVNDSSGSFTMPQPCRYHRDNACAVHDIKPSVCREYPMHFRKSKDQDPGWVIITACPGGKKLLELLLNGRQEGLEYRVY